MTDRVGTCLFFDDNAEEAVNFYVSLLPDSRIVSISHYGAANPGQAGKAMLIVFELGGRRYWALNGGMDFPFSEAVSMVVTCDTQAEIDRLWERLGDGGREQACGWIKDRFGMSWQVVPSATERWHSGDQEATDRMMKALLGMVKLDIATLERAYKGEDVHA